MYWPNIERSIATHTGIKSILAKEVVKYLSSLLPEPSFSVDNDYIILSFVAGKSTAHI